MQSSELITKLRRNIGNPSSTDVTDATLLEYLNTAYREIVNKYRFTQNRKRVEFNLIAGSSDYQLPTDANVLLRVRDQTNERVIEKYDDANASRIADQTTTGMPLKYVKYQDYIRFFPTPDDDYLVEVYYKFDVVDLTGANDEPIFPEPWIIGLLKLARFHFYDDEGDVEKADVAYKSWMRWIGDKPQESDEEKVGFDSGVAFPELEGSVDLRLDFDHSD